MYLFDKTTGKRGSTEVESSLDSFLREHGTGARCLYLIMNQMSCWKFHLKHCFRQGKVAYKAGSG